MLLAIKWKVLKKICTPIFVLKIFHLNSQNYQKNMQSYFISKYMEGRTYVSIVHCTPHADISERRPAYQYDAFLGKVKKYILTSALLYTMEWQEEEKKVFNQNMYFAVLPHHFPHIFSGIYFCYFHKSNNIKLSSLSDLSCLYSTLILFFLM